MKSSNSRNGGTNDLPPTRQQKQTRNKLLPHPQWTRLIFHIQQAAKAYCTLLLTRIIGKIIGASNKTASNELLNFVSVILSKPKRAGANRNLSNIIHKRIAAWDKDNPHTDCSADPIKTRSGNFKAIVRIISSSEAPALANQDTLKALQSKHPGPAADLRTSVDPNNNFRFEPLQICSGDVFEALYSFSLGSSGVSDGLTPQHITDLLTGLTDKNLLQALTDLVNLLLARSINNEVTIIYGGRLIALSRKDGGVRLIAIDYTLRWLTVPLIMKIEQISLMHSTPSKEI